MCDPPPTPPHPRLLSADGAGLQELLCKFCTGCSAGTSRPQPSVGALREGQSALLGATGGRSQVPALPAGQVLKSRLVSAHHLLHSPLWLQGSEDSWSE